jgi:hypothetical protein
MIQLMKVVDAHWFDLGTLRFDGQQTESVLYPWISDQGDRFLQF